MMKNIQTGIVTLLLLLTTSAVLATGFEALVDRGKQHLLTGDYRAAHSAFKQGFVAARSIDDRKAMAKFRFLTANTYLVAAEKNTSGDQQNLAKKAIRPYREVIRMRPDSGSAKVNLARAYAIVGNNAEADRLYRQAIDLNDKKQPQYRSQYAKFLKQTDPERAAKELQAVVKSQPNNATAKRSLMKVYQTPDLAEKLPGYLTRQIEEGNVLQSQNSALEALEGSQLSATNQAELMTVIARGLTQQQIAPDAFDNSDAARRLWRIAEMHPALTRCVNELMETMTTGKVSNYHWWSATDERAAAISNLMRSRARFYDQDGNQEIAEKLYSGAAKIAGANDPKAVQDLVNFYSRRGDLEGINQVSNTYEYELFQSKNAAYAKRDEEAIYDYHRTLASIYSFQASKTGDWGSPTKVNSAAFQLQRAYETAARSDVITPDPKLVTSLASSYEARGLDRQANKLQIDAVRDYTAKGNMTAASTVLANIDETRLPIPDRNRLDPIIETRPAVVPVPPTRPAIQKPAFPTAKPPVTIPPVTKLPIEKPPVDFGTKIKDLQTKLRLGNVGSVTNKAIDTASPKQTTGKTGTADQAKQKTDLLKQMQRQQQQKQRQEQLQQQAKQASQQTAKSQSINQSIFKNTAQQNQRPAAKVTTKPKLDFKQVLKEVEGKN